MSAATVTDITTVAAKREKAKTDNISISITLDEDLHQKLMIDSLLGKKPVGTMVEEWIDKYVSLQDVSIGLSTLMNHNPVREKIDPDVVMKGLSIPVSKRHYGMIKMEAIRQQTSTRALLKDWIQENVSNWFYEQIEPEEWQQKAA
jgi:hypothetical protein